MNRRTLHLLLYLMFTLPWPAFAGQNDDSNWSYSVKDNVEKSKRDYLLVYLPDTKHEKRLRVISQCERPYNAEGAYGSCTHSVNLQPTDTSFKLDTGEDVVLVKFTWDAPLILATIAYGCCAGPDVVRFYTEKGEYIGAIRGRDVSLRANWENVIGRTFDMGNGARYGNRIYLLIQSSERNKEFHAWVYDADGNISNMPLLFSFAKKKKEVCEDWHIEKFTAYGDRNDLILKMKGSWCTEDDNDEQYFSCTISDQAINCRPVKVTKVENIPGALQITDIDEK